MRQRKVCILGATGVGKTSLTKQYVEGIFSEKYLTTIGVKIDKKSVTTPKEDIQLLIWDMEGIDRYCGFNPRYLRGAGSYIVVVDQTRSQSLIEGAEILQMARQHTDAPAILAINKADLAASWHWEQSEIDQHAKAFNCYLQTSAKTGIGVDELFLSAATLGTDDAEL